MSEAEAYDPDENEHDLDGDGTISVGELFSYLANKRADATGEDATALSVLGTPEESAAIGWVKTCDICADLGIDVTTFHQLKTKLQRTFAEDDITLVGVPDPSDLSGGWIWRLIGNAGDVVGREYITRRLRNIRGRHVSTESIVSSLTKMAEAPGVSLGVGNQWQDDAFRLRLRSLLREERRVIEDIDAMLADLSS